MQQIGLPVIGSIGAGTKALYQFGQWQQRQRSPQQTLSQIAVFRKGDRRQIVHSCGNECGLLTMADTKPKVVAFREWREEFAIVSSKLIARGWQLEDGGEVKHAHHH